MKFKKYQHIEKIGHPEVKDLLFGKCYIFPKIDGTNASIWMDEGKMQCGSRNRHLTLEKDNAGFMAWAIQQNNLVEFFENHPDIRLFGEWLVPHTLKTYHKDAWNNFYVFDVLGHNEDLEKGYEYLEYDRYKELLDAYDINYIPPLATMESPKKSALDRYLDKNVFLIDDSCGTGEGIVIKNYGYKSHTGRQAWAKIVKNEFKMQAHKTMGAPAHETHKHDIEAGIVELFVTDVLIDKTFAKITLNEDWQKKLIPKLLNMVFYDLISEEIWHILKKFKNPEIDFKRLMGLTFAKVKQHKNDIF